MVYVPILGSLGVSFEETKHDFNELDGVFDNTARTEELNFAQQNS
jgi:hypothetical protein